MTELLDKREGFKEFIDAIQLKPECQGLSFGAYLIMPIQRKPSSAPPSFFTEMELRHLILALGIPRYRMLLEDLIKNTEETHPDKKGLTAALGELLVVANKVNQAVIQQEQAERLLKVAKRFQDYKDLDVHPQPPPILGLFDSSHVLQILISCFRSSNLEGHLLWKVKCQKFVEKKQKEEHSFYFQICSFMLMPTVVESK